MWFEVAGGHQAAVLHGKIFADDVRWWGRTQQAVLHEDCLAWQVSWWGRMQTGLLPGLDNG